MVTDPTGPTVAPYGTWTSPITAELLTADSVTLGAPQLDGGALYWTQARASDGGRTTLLRDGQELTPDHYLRSRVHEYGGGAWHVRDGVVVFSDFPSDVLYRLDPGRPPQQITPTGSGLRYADLRVHPGRDLVLAVREDHRGDGEAVNTIVALRLNAPNPDGGTVLCQGADFYASPELAADGRLAWVEWEHPNMPWDHTRLRVGLLAADHVQDATVVAGRSGEAPMAPAWCDDGLVFLTDRSGYWNFYRADRDGAVTRLHEDDHDFAGPAWTLGAGEYVLLPDRRIVAGQFDGGRMHLVVVDLDGRVSVLDPAPVSIGGFSIDGDRLAMLQAYPDRPSAIVTVPTELVGEKDATTVTTVTTASALKLPAGTVSAPESVSWDGPDGPVQAWYYRPTSADQVAPEGDLPPVITLSHGGPTGLSTPDLNLVKQFWTSRGFAVVDVNYGGSAGFGRAYRQRLAGRWGEVDVRDCADAARVLVDRGLADPRRLVIMGGSAGGYTTLRALTATDVFSLGISLYGVGDLGALAQDTHKFESRYLDGLVGPWPEAKGIYAERSPINHIDQLCCPMLILHGADDKVVPPSQARQMAEAVAANGLACQLIIFDGEGHGFRKAENIQRTYTAALEFCRRTFGLT